MQYCITMERRVRFAKWFEAPDDEAAREEAKLIELLTEDAEYEAGESEYDYAVACEDGRYIIHWG